MKITDIIESFNTTVPGEVITRLPNKYVVKGNVGGRTIVFDAYKSDSYMWTVIFSEGEGDDAVYTTTGAGSPMQVFSFVIDCINKFTNEVSPEQFKFSGDKDEPSRIKLYNRLALSNKFKGYKFIGRDELKFEIEFLFKKV